MTFTQIRDINHQVKLYPTDREIAEHLKKLGLGKYAATIFASLRTRHLTQFDFIKIFESEKSQSKKESINKIPKQKSQFKVAKGLSELRETFLFCWDDHNRLRDFLHLNYGIKWVETARIERIDEGRTIKVSDGKNYLTLTLDDNWKIIHAPTLKLNSWRWKQQKYSTKVNLIIDDGRRDEFEGKMIGKPAKLRIFKNRGWLDEREVEKFSVDGKNTKYKVYSLNIHYLFSWDEIPGNDNEKLVKFLGPMYEIDWVKKAKIEKIDEDKTITVSTKKNSLSLRLNDEKTKVNVKIDDGRTFELKVRTENNKLNIYKILFENIIAELEKQVKEIWKKKQATIGQLNEKNKEITDSLISLGMSRPMARVLSHFKNKNEVTSDELERSKRLRQPEVSIAMKQLKERDWINERKEKKLGKGRPFKIYALKAEFKDIITHIEKQHKKVFEDAMAASEQLKKMVRK